jgi:chemotaxis protein CheX
MATVQTITDTLIQDFIVRAVQNVCQTMLRQEAGFVEKQLVGAVLGDRAHIIGNVGFAGDVSGVVYLCIPDDFAHEAAAQVLGMSAGEVAMSGSEVVKDVVGEITNMIVGGFKNALCDIGFPCKLTVPTIVRGDRLSIATLRSATRHIFRFDCSGHRLVADIQLKLD